jgi:hypothetical protein
MRMSEVPYQRQPQIDQAEQEIETATAYGQTDRVAAAEKVLRSLREDAGLKRKRAASDDDDDNKAPAGRSTRQGRQQTTDK